MTTREKITKQVEHPLEELFELPSGSTEITVTQRQTEVVACDQFDNKDKEIEEQFQEVYDVAMSTFENTVDLIERSETDPKYVARQMEVAAQFLNTALHAAKEKASLKTQKDRLLAAQRTASVQAGNAIPSAGGNGEPIVMSHSALLKMLKAAKESDNGDVIEGEVQK